MVPTEAKWVIATLTCMGLFASIGYYGYKKGLAVFGGGMALIPPAVVAAYICGVALSTPGTNFDFNF